MKTEPLPGPATDEQVPSQTLAEAYLERELIKARRAFRRSGITSLIMICLVGTYMTVLSFVLIRFLQPREAAQVATGILVQHIQNNGPALAAQLEREIPLLIRKAPVHLLQQLPACREHLEKTLALEFHGRCAVFGIELGAQIDRLMEEHKNQIRGLLDNPGDRAQLRAFLPDLQQAITGFLNTDSDGRQVKKQIAELAATLTQIEQRVDRLANGTNLTLEEQKARRALAMLARVIENQTALPGPAQTASTPPRANR
jgi:hypothetical protein